MDDKLAQHWRTFVGQSSMPKNQPPQVFKFVNWKVSGQRSLLAFLTDNADTNIRLQNHTNIVTAVADGASSFVSKLADLFSDVGFLSWRAATDANRRCFCSSRVELLFKCWFAQDDVKWRSVNHQKSVCFLLKINQAEFSLTHRSKITHCEDGLTPIFKASRNCNARRRLYLVPRKHPYLDAGRAQGFDCHGNFVL